MKKSILLIIILSLVTMISWLSLDNWSRIQLEKARDDWPLINQSLEGFSKVFPKTSENQVANHLEGLYSQLRYDRGKIDESVDNSSAPDKSSFHTGISTYLKRELEKQINIVNKPDVRIVRFLETNAKVLDEIRSTLVERELPVYFFDAEIHPTEELPSSPLPIKLSRLLITKTLLLHTEKRYTEAWSYIHAATRLADSRFSRPELVSQIIAIAEAQEILLAMRKMAAPIPIWAAGWPDHDFEYFMMMAFTQEARRYLTMSESLDIISYIQWINKIAIVNFGGKPVEVGIGTRIISIFVECQYLRLYSAQFINAWKQAIEHRMQEDLCVAQPESITTIKEQISAWLAESDLSKAINFGGFEFDFVNLLWFRLHRLKIYQAGTSAILNAKDTREKSPFNEWPKIVSGKIAKCEPLSWDYQVTSEGDVHFEYLKPLPEGVLEQKIPEGHLQYIERAGS